VRLNQPGNLAIESKKFWEYKERPLASWNEGATKQSSICQAADAGSVVQTNLNEDEVNSLKKALKKGVVPASSAK
jgi:hypothetical protein